jgi:hypothetical protein
VFLGCRKSNFFKFHIPSNLTGITITPTRIAFSTGEEVLITHHPQLSSKVTEAAVKYSQDTQHMSVSILLPMSEYWYAIQMIM